MLTSRTTVAVVSPLAAVTRGLSRMLADHADQVQVVDLSTGRRADPAQADPDVILYDAHGLASGDGADLAHLVATTTSVVVAVRHELRPALGAEAMAHGAHGTVDLAVDRDTLLETVLLAAQVGRPEAAVLAKPERLGASVGLTPREVDVLTQITLGFSNQEIAEQSYLSINSVKTYIRSAYRRIGATSRAQAVVWCVKNGFPSEVAA